MDCFVTERGVSDEITHRVCWKVIFSHVNVVHWSPHRLLFYPRPLGGGENNYSIITAKRSGCGNDVSGRRWAASGRTWRWCCEAPRNGSLPGNKSKIRRLAAVESSPTGNYLTDSKPPTSSRTWGSGLMCILSSEAQQAQCATAAHRKPLFYSLKWLKMIY